MENNELKTNLETYQAQLKQVEAALMIDEENEELVKLKSDLLEVIELTSDLLSINVPSSDKKKQSKPFVEKDEVNESSKKEVSKSIKLNEKQIEPAQLSLETDVATTTTTTTASDDTQKRTADDADIDFEAMFNLPKRVATSETQLYENEDIKEDEEDVESKPKEKNIKLSREEQEKRREQRKKKLLKKKQRVKEIEEQREREKSNWQDFRKAPTKGKGKLRGLVKKSIFASPDTSVGKVGVGTCGIGGRGMTNYENPTQYIYKK